MMTCPKCGCRKFQAGPTGGMSQNFRCENHHYWNVSHFGMQDIGESSWARSDAAPGCSCEEAP